MKLFDYRFEFSGDLHKGVQVIRIDMHGLSMYEVDIYRLQDGKSVADLKTWRKQEGRGPAPAEAWAARSTVMMSTGWYGCERISPRGALRPAL